MAHSNQGIVKNRKGEEQPADKDRRRRGTRAIPLGLSRGRQPAIPS